MGTCPRCKQRITEVCEVCEQDIPPIVAFGLTKPELKYLHDFSNLWGLHGKVDYGEMSPATGYERYAILLEMDPVERETMLANARKQVELIDAEIRLRIKDRKGQDPGPTSSLRTLDKMDKSIRRGEER